MRGGPHANDHAVRLVMFFLAAGYQRPREGGRDGAKPCGKNAIKLTDVCCLLTLAKSSWGSLGRGGGQVPAIKTLRGSSREEIKIKEVFQREVSSLGGS